MKQIAIFLGLLMGVSHGLHAQELRQTIRGQVFDAVTRYTLSGVNISIPDISLGVSTDEEGRFVLENVPIGRYQVTISHVGYETRILPNVVVDAGKMPVLEITLEEQITTLEAVEIGPEQERTPFRQIEPVSSFNFTTEKSLRYPATFFDPGRLALSFAGVASNFDQSNHIVVRGNSPNGLNWRMHGVDIVNPNHLTNAGTFSDRASLSGGGVSVLSAQLLDDSRFYTGAYPAGMGNALSGVFDVQFRKGNTIENEYTFQAGLLGVDASAEGPMGSRQQGSYLFNYRYSTIGLISALGVDIGDEAISFQDLGFNLHWDAGKAGEFNLFGTGGLSRENFEASRDSTLWQSQEDRYDVRFESDMGALGLRHKLNLNKKALWQNVVAFSAIGNARRGSFINENHNKVDLEYDKISKSMLSFRSQMTLKMNPKNSFNAGIQVNHINYNQFSENGYPGQSITTIVDFSGTYQVFQPFVQREWNLAKRWTMASGLHGLFTSINSDFNIEPRFRISYLPDNRQRISFNYGLHSMLQPASVYFTTFELENRVIYPNRDLALSKAHHWLLQHEWQIGNTLQLKTVAYYQELFDIPIAPGVDRSFSVLNILEEMVTDSLVNEGTGRNYGLEVSLQQNMKSGIYYVLNTALYEAKYTGGDGIERDSRFNGNFNLNLTAGKEFIPKNKQNNRVGINTRILYQGGFRQSPINIAASTSSNTTVFDESKAFSRQLPAYFRADLSFILKKNKKNYTRIWSLDIQNVLNRQNVAYLYYDLQAQDVITKYQLGILPFLSYRIQF
ncbi:MAG: TonB-dependent receptor [Cyclobacteriaceae bacterium]